MGFRQVEENHIMENVIYNELRSRNFRVDVGTIEVREKNVRKQLEVDFVANRGSSKYYIQSAFAINDDAKREQEIASLRKINDAFKRIIVVKDDIVPQYNEDGFLIVGLYDFLLDPTILE